MIDVLKRILTRVHMTMQLRQHKIAGKKLHSVRHYIALIRCLQICQCSTHFIERTEDMKFGCRIGESSTVMCAMFTLVVQSFVKGKCVHDLFSTH